MCAYPDPIFAPPRIYVLEDVYGNADAAKRADRICSSFPKAEVRKFTYADMPEIVKEEKWYDRPQMGEYDEIPPLIPVLNLFRFDKDAVARDTKMMEDAYDGPGKFDFGTIASGHPFVFAKFAFGDNFGPASRIVCRPCWRTHIGFGCPHQCAYCGLAKVMSSALNVEDFLEHLAKLIKRNPWQTTYLIDDAMDMLAIEPQWDMLPPMMRFFEKTGDRYLILHTKSDRAQALIDAGAPKNLIIAWSLSAKTQSSVIEPNTGNTAGRIAAGKACQEAGMTVRYKFKPIVPVKGWREECDEMMELLFSQITPDNLSMTVIMWKTLERLLRCIPADMLDPELLQMAEDASEEMHDNRLGPFPDAAREIVYRYYFEQIRKHDKNIPVTVSTEGTALWARMGKVLGVDPGNFVCGCGPTADPCMKGLPENPYVQARQAVTWDGKPALPELAEMQQAASCE